jgi:lipoyl-dependent peroxiredoxin subunit D
LGTKTENKYYQTLLQELNTDNLDSHGFQFLAKAQSRYMGDLAGNVQKAMEMANLSKKESVLISLSIAINDKNPRLEEVFLSLAQDLKVPESEIAEVYACTSLLNMNNVLYRFRHVVPKDAYKMPSGLKMTVKSSPVLGKEFFTLMSLAISAANGCEACMIEHENNAIQLGCSENRIFDVVKVAAIIRSLGNLA